jgi:hypothetical protein
MDRLPRDRAGRSQVDLKQVECKREREGARDLYRHGPASQERQKGPPSSQAAVKLEVVELRVATEECGDAVAVLTTVWVSLPAAVALPLDRLGFSLSVG